MSPATGLPLSLPSAEKPSPQTSQIERLLTLLQQAVSLQQETVQKYAALAAEQSRQLTIVLQERFYRPMLTPDDTAKQAHDVAHDPAQMTDVLEFSQDGDREDIGRDEKENQRLEAELDAGFTEIAQEHEAVHAGGV